MKNYYRIILGSKNKYLKEAITESYIGVGFLPNSDLTNQFSDTWREFNSNYIPVYLKELPNKSKVAAGLGCAATWMVGKYLNKGDIVITPSGNRDYFIGEVSGEYEYAPGTDLPHRRKVTWYPSKINRDDMTQELKNSSGSVLTLVDLSKYSSELDRLITGNSQNIISSQDTTIEDSSLFALEKHLEDFLVTNWQHTDLGKNYDIYDEDGELVGQQYPTDTGPIDILAVSKDKKELLVVELKKGRASDYVVGQIQRYMGYVVEELAEENQNVKGIIIAFEDDIKIQRALKVTSNIEFYTYKINFNLEKK